MSTIIPPPHVHVVGDGVAKVDLEPTVALVYRRGLSKADVRPALDVVGSHRPQMLEAWKRIHG